MKHYLKPSVGPQNSDASKDDHVWRLAARRYEGDGSDEIFVKVIRKPVGITVDRLVICVALLFTVGVMAISWQVWMQ
jgi:hypothetical protein